MANLDISVVVICRNEEGRIGECLESLAAQNYPKSSYEIVVVDNLSTDSTAEVVREFIRGHPYMRLVLNPKRGIAPSRNFGLKEARYEHVAYTDADCRAEPGWLSALDAAFRLESEKDPKVAAVGGPNIPPLQTTLFRRAVAVAVTNYWGNHGSVQGAGPGERADVEHLPTLNILYDRKKVLELNGFDVNQGNISEDVDMSFRLRRKGYRLIYEPKAVILHRWRESLWGWMKNMEVYGKGRSWLIKKDRRHAKPQFAAPLLLLGAFALSFFASICVWAAVPWSIYLGMTLLVSLYACLKHGKPHYLPIVFVIYVVTHLAYGVGQIHGLFVPRGSDIK